MNGLDRMRKELQLQGSERSLAPRLPVLNVIEPNEEFGLTHNKNLPFSYTGGSPTRTSPTRTSSFVQGSRQVSDLKLVQSNSFLNRVFVEKLL